jgi:hypothetical protein
MGGSRLGAMGNLIAKIRKLLRLDKDVKKP